MTNQEFINKLLNIVNNYKTIYAYGTWGQILTNNVITSKTKQYPGWYTSANQKKLKNLVGKGYYVFDCVGMIKGVLWGWCGNGTTNGGATYQANGVPDVSANGMIEKCYDVSSNMNNITMGEVVWMNGHIGVYYQNNQVIECSPAFKDKVQITNLSQRKWLKHGKLPYITYSNNSFLPPRGYFMPGDSGANVEKIDSWLASWIPTQVKGNYYGNFTEKSIMALQQKAKNDGIYNDAIDGCCGSKTLNAMEHYGFKK